MSYVYQVRDEDIAVSEIAIRLFVAAGIPDRLFVVLDNIERAEHLKSLETDLVFVVSSFDEVVGFSHANLVFDDDESEQLAEVRQWGEYLAGESNRRRGVFPVISVILPVHNMTPWVARSVASVLDQDYPNIDLVVVADACTDSTVEITRELGVEPLIINEKSLGAARNAGMNVAIGDYFLFLDGDDYFIGRDAIRSISEALQQDLKTDVLHFDFEWGRGRRYRPIPITDRAVDNPGGVVPMVWCRAWRAEVARDIRFIRGLHEDNDFVNRMLSMSISHNYLPKMVYFYEYPRSGSLMSSEYGLPDRNWRPPAMAANEVLNN
ncbi:glycosyltransferase [Dermatophilus congolensis]|uniref:glycosyltransferase n=1 Tax=Dermatophilus congolensis TaxID=1863 RepID=UPI001AAFAC35|nr:glycosyltransferase family 2 protein [Dermatophilus congolensis]MBO3152415.1 glycosyltransferase family 2 protein [Dermatophilus congolensis]MBO3160574.1 glycosyltransferase family 2 protein [Dermatophilus congolensis]MBO3163702.1 glycosyltransferase family 2 protein [Dermatophilus congolensis]MBO3177248.1 glycosyltransferase family 2 protein [Dermatophilus congolensis]